MMKGKISRRTVLRGMGTALALPWLEAMGPLSAWADATAAKRAPNRMAFVYVPNGVHMPAWRPTSEGASFQLSATLEPLAAYKDELLVLTGLTVDKARPNGDGPGDHARAMSAFLTGCQPFKTNGANIHAGVSVDQAAALRVGAQTRLASLEIGCEGGGMAGNCDSGYSCAYSSTISWRTATTPNPKIVNPRQVFNRLFAAETQTRRTQDRRSILDFVREDAGALQVQLGSNDRRKLDEYLAAVRDVEQRIQRAEALPRAQVPRYTTPDRTPAYQEQIRMLADLLALAFQTDSTRIATFVFANEGSNRPYPFLEVREGHHDLSHHQNDPVKQAKLATINRFHVTQLAYLLGKLKAVREGDGTLLDHCMIVYGSGIDDGNRHNHDDLPILFAGKAGNSVRTGRHVRYRNNTPLNNLWLAMLDRMGSSVDALGDSTGRLPNLT